MHEKSLQEAADRLDRSDWDGVATIVDPILQSIVGPLGDAWLTIEISALLAQLDTRHAQALARVLWIASVVDEARGHLDRAKDRGRRAMELYARLRMPIEELDVRAARELASASTRFRDRSGNP